MDTSCGFPLIDRGLVAVNGQTPFAIGPLRFHREELLADWELAKEGVELFRIDPLK